MYTNKDVDQLMNILVNNGSLYLDNGNRLLGYPAQDMLMVTNGKDKILGRLSLNKECLKIALAKYQ